MKLGIITGHVVATRKDENLIGAKLLIIQPILPDGAPAGQPVVAVDTVGAGIGETIIYAVGSVASRATQHPNAPVDAAIVGIVDSVDCARTGGV
ncbi:EutN/CcmL family microcompartment protein [Paenibacillus tianjinensis]|uniref:EutN/CcmL family microcompartment protein n=1 Tax=Paenibacillus tianjinensis TaxID=2810347 RepID=A0ABX7LAM5_9BACL|nr:EutN/CcmL family microcompartment protein [Paenibacillus tianjinensis]QSF44433.1 EutN/CcmL family microcompartment protein [Paenibacillus tianjinensis]